MRRFSRRADQALKLAHEAAREYGQGYVGTEHLLLGIVREGTSLAARILLECGATEYQIKALVDELARVRLAESWVTGRLPGSPHYMDVFARSERIAERLKQPQVCAEHLLAALLTQTCSIGCEVLRTLGVSMQAIEDAFHEQVPAGCS